MSAFTRDRKSILYGIAIAVLLVAVLARYGVFSGSDTAPAVAAVDSVPLAEKRLEVLRKKAAVGEAHHATLLQWIEGKPPFTILDFGCGPAGAFR